MENIVANLVASKVRRETLNGRSYLVAPVTMIVSGVLNGSKGPLYYPPEECAKSPGDWDGMPIVVYHPKIDGVYVSARRPDVAEKYEVGRVYNSNFNDKTNKLCSEAWFDEELTKKVDDRVYNALVEGKSLEVSTGLFTENELAPDNSVHNGKPYTYIAKNYRPDHLAVLPDQTGACSIKDGCGLMVNELSYMQVYDRLCEALRVKYPRTYDVEGNTLTGRVYVTDVYADYFVYEEATGGGTLGVTQSQLYKQAYSVDSNDNLTLDGEPEPVRKVVSYESATQNSNKGTTTVNRNEMISFLTTNCECWKAPEDQKALNIVSDAGLTKLVETAKKLQQQPAPVANTVTTPPVPIAQPVQTQPLTYEQWLATAPPQGKMLLQNAAQVVQAETTKLVQELTAHMANQEQRTQVQQYLAQKPLEELRVMKLMLPPTPAVVNANPYFGTLPGLQHLIPPVDQSSTQQQQVPPYPGMQVPPGPAVNYGPAAVVPSTGAVTPTGNQAGDDDEILLPAVMSYTNQ